MARFFKKREANRGQSPGALIFIGEQKVETVQCHLISYNNLDLKEIPLNPASIKMEVQQCGSEQITWLNVNGLHDIDIIRDIGHLFDIHPLVLEDILNTGQRPKLEEFDNFFFIVMKMVRFDKEKQMIVNEQLSMIVGGGFLLSFQERPGDVFEPVRERIRKHKGRIRNSGSDYLSYAMMDSVVDNYIYIVERLGEKIEDLEEEILAGPNSGVMEKINIFKRELNYLRKSIRPAREAIAQISRLDNDLIHEQSIPFFKDLTDLVTHVTEAIDTYQDLLTDQLNIYNSVVGNRLNDIMKVLTVFSAIFIPLTFIAGIYGTNFDYLPELHYKYSYFILWGVMLVIAGLLVMFFKRKGWF
ncbi:Magnesium transport protein CorA [Desulfamplus magnetovallimortis]|uniref:Magnesium transport protein CorA n=1 Tax=Desulfamplus magnetovallimortis TaxID=1246637 RepID=A0A1W1HBG7_9BACT|nr:magnesium/cobalt transporter CorA [Desulfamplus magnetovallimortis]SLM29735.1 Magnesium transport protein CorA [Desulfamplus magnetovallimortis]